MATQQPPKLHDWGSSPHPGAATRLGRGDKPRPRCHAEVAQLVERDSEKVGRRRFEPAPWH